MLHDDLLWILDIANTHVRFYANDIVCIAHTLWPGKYGIGNVFK